MIVLKGNEESVISVFLTRIINALVLELYLPDLLLKNGVQNNLFETIEPLLTKFAFSDWLNSYWNTKIDGTFQSNSNSKITSIIENSYENLLKLEDIIKANEGISETILVEFEIID